MNFVEINVSWFTGFAVVVEVIGLHGVCVFRGRHERDSSSLYINSGVALKLNRSCQWFFFSPLWPAGAFSG